MLGYKGSRQKNHQLGPFKNLKGVHFKLLNETIGKLVKNTTNNEKNKKKFNLSTQNISNWT